jgi:WXG100 family type VII secretion target
MSTTTSTPTVSPFTVDLVQLGSAITSVQASADTITGLVGQVNSNLDAVSGEWSSPAYQTFAALLPDVTNDMNKLVTLMNEMVVRMQAAQTTYSNIERANASSLSVG